MTESNTDRLLQSWGMGYEKQYFWLKEIKAVVGGS